MSSLTRFLFPITLSGIGDTPEQAWQDAVESFSLDPGCYEIYTKEVDSDDEIPQGQPVPIPDYKINYYPVAYIHVQNPETFDEIQRFLNELISRDGQILISREELSQQLKSIEEGLDINADPQEALSLSESEKEAFDFLVGINMELENFGGDVWFYAN
jgi:hypothetical protein